MLQKEICVRCMMMGWKTGWIEVDEVRWQNGFVACPKGHDLFDTGLLGNQHGRISEGPRQGCHFYFEQLVMGQEK